MPSPFADAQRYLPGGVNSPVRAFKAVGMDPVFVDRGEGEYLFDIDGVRYLDFCMSWGASILGHAHPAIIDAVTSALCKGTSFGAPTVIETEMARTVCSLIPSIEKIRFVNSGTEAVMTAIRLARAFTGREKILKFDGCYHGHSDPMLVSAGSGVAELPTSCSAGVGKEMVGATLSIPFNDSDAFMECVERHGASLAAVIVEPVPANMGLVLPNNGYLHLMRELTRRYGILLIFDEVITGFRLGLGGAQGRFGITPDLTCLGKIIGGGFPVGAVGGRDDVMSQLSPQGPVYQAGTLSGNPIAMTAGLTALRFLRDHPESYETMEKVVDAFATKWKSQSRLTLNHLGSMFTIFWTERPVASFADANKQDLNLFRSRYRDYLSRGMYLPPSMFETSFVSILHRAEQLDLLIDCHTSS